MSRITPSTISEASPHTAILQPVSSRKLGGPPPCVAYSMHWSLALAVIISFRLTTKNARETDASTATARRGKIIRQWHSLEQTFPAFLVVVTSTFWLGTWSSMLDQESWVASLQPHSQAGWSAPVPCYAYHVASKTLGGGEEASRLDKCGWIGYCEFLTTSGCKNC